MANDYTFKDSILFAPIEEDDDFNENPLTISPVVQIDRVAKEALLKYVTGTVLNKRKKGDNNLLRLRELLDKESKKASILSDVHLFPYSQDEPWRWHEKRRYWSGRVFGCHTEISVSEDLQKTSVYIEVD